MSVFAEHIEDEAQVISFRDIVQYGGRNVSTHLTKGYMRLYVGTYLGNSIICSVLETHNKDTTKIIKAQAWPFDHNDYHLKPIDIRGDTDRYEIEGPCPWNPRPYLIYEDRSQWPLNVLEILTVLEGLENG